jgi:hypothetical protein
MLAERGRRRPSCSIPREGIASAAKGIVDRSVVTRFTSRAGATFATAECETP